MMLELWWLTLSVRPCTHSMAARNICVIYDSSTGLTVDKNSSLLVNVYIYSLMGILEYDLDDF